MVLTSAHARSSLVCSGGSARRQRTAQRSHAPPGLPQALARDS